MASALMRSTRDTPPWQGRVGQGKQVQTPARSGFPGRERLTQSQFQAVRIHIQSTEVYFLLFPFQSSERISVCSLSLSLSPASKKNCLFLFTFSTANDGFFHSEQQMPGTALNSFLSSISFKCHALPARSFSPTLSVGNQKLREGG